MRTTLRLAAFLVALPLAAQAQGRILPRPCPPRGTPIEPRIDQPSPRPCFTVPDQMIVRTRSDVRATLDDRVLRYEVDERFTNRGGRVGEADYLFPLPNGAAFQDLKLSINGEMVSGETLGADEARRVYEEIVRRQRDPALVEWMGMGLLRARIFPIAPGEEKRVAVRYQAVAQREGDALRLDYDFGAASAADVSFTLILPGGSRYGTPYSPTQSLDVRDEGGERTVTLRPGASRMVTILLPIPRSNAAAITVLPHAPGGEDGFALLTVSPPSASRRAVTPRDVTLVLDVSGSMSGRKMEQARAAGRQLLATLRPEDRFRLIDFSTDVHDFRDGYVYATRENLRDAQRYLDALEAGGSTNISGALQEALGDAPESRGRLGVVLFVTDGEPTVGERSPDAIADQAKRLRGDRRVFTFGVGTDVNAALLEQLALQGRGTAQFVRPEESVERAVSLVASRLVDPVATDLRVRVEGEDGEDVSLLKMLPSQPVDLFAGQDLVLLARYRGHGDARIVVEGRSTAGPVRWTSEARFPERERANPFVARLWATQRIGWLSAEKRKATGSDTREIDDEIRSLGERFGIPTEFTSYFVREPMPVADVGVGTRRRVVAGGVAGAPMTAPAPSQAQRFEAARAASAQRSAVSLSEIAVADSSAAGRQVGTRHFTLVDGRWTDAGYTASMRLVKVAPYSKAYFDLVQAIPELKECFALGDRVLVAGRRVAVEVTDGGASDLSSDAMGRVKSEW